MATGIARRQFMFALGVVAAGWPLTAHAQQSKVRLIGVLLLGNADAKSFRTELRDGLRKLGYVEGQNINFEFRSADGKFDLLPKLGAELVALRVSSGSLSRGKNHSNQITPVAPNPPRPLAEPQ